MRREDDVRHPVQRVVRARGFDLEDIEAGAGDPLLLQRLDQRGLVHRRPAAGGDEDRVLLHLAEVVFLEEAARLGRVGQVHGHEVGGGQDLGQRRRLDAEGRERQFLDIRIEGLHVQAEGLGTPRGGARHAPEADEAERLAHQARDLQKLRAAFGPAALAHHAVLFDAATMCGEQQHHRVVGHFLDEGVGAVGDRNALGRRRRDIHIVHAHGAERDVAALRQRVDHRRGELHALGIDRIRRGGGGDEAFLGGGAFDDLGARAFQRLHLVGVAAARRGEGCAGGREDGVLRQGCLSWLQPPPIPSPRR